MAKTSKHTVIGICPQCGREFETPRKWQKFCSRDCRREHYISYQQTIRDFYKANCK